MAVVAAKAWHACGGDGVARDLGVDAAVGLSRELVTQRRAEHGENRLTPPPKPHFLQRLWHHCNNTLMALLTATVVISGVFGDWIELGLICLVMVTNVAISMAQEGRAEQAASAISAMLAPSAVVVRDSVRVKVNAAELVPGDVVVLSSGDSVPADLRLLTCNNLQIQEAALTGESAAVTKTTAAVREDAPLGDRTCLAFSSTFVSRGSGLGIVVATGDRAEIGRVNAMMRSVAPPKAPLVQQLELLGRALAILAIVLALATFFIAWQGRNYAPIAAVRIAISIAVAVIPEGLLSVVTITLAIGSQHLASQKAIVRSMPAIETLGSVSVICSDKTGTLTKNEMTAVAVITASATFRVTGTGYNPEGDFKRDDDPASAADVHRLRSLLLPAVLTNDSRLVCKDRGGPTLLLPPQRVTATWGRRSDSRRAARSAALPIVQALRQDWSVVGEPTEGALLAVAEKAGLPGDVTRNSCKRLAVLPFDSAHKFMATLHEADVEAGVAPSPRTARTARATAAGVGLTAAFPPAHSSGSSTPRSGGGEASTERAEQRLVFVKGAADVIVRACSHVVNDSEDGAAPLALDRARWEAVVTEFAAQGLRVLALAHGHVAADKADLTVADVTGGEPHLTLRCLVAIVDPPRDEAISAVRDSLSAGITVKMITGDHAQTALTIASWLGIASEGAMTGQEIERMSDEELAGRVMGCNVYARVSPEHKLRVVRALQARGQVTAMTGDGVNDAPALKQADIGVAMGLGGTDVARNAARMVLADDNFATLVTAVREGRGINDNLRKLLLFSLPTNLSQGVSIVAAMVLGMPTPLTALQVLFGNMLTSVTLGIVLALEPTEAGVMLRKPRRAGKGLLGKFVLWRLVFVTTLLVVAIVGNAQWERALGGSENEARTVATCNLVVSQCFYCLACRYLSKPSVNPRTLWENPWVPAAIMLDVALLALISYTPGVQGVFTTAALDGLSWLRVLFLAVAVFGIIEVEKAIGPKYVNPWVLPVVRAVRNALCGRCLPPPRPVIADLPPITTIRGLGSLPASSSSVHLAIDDAASVAPPAGPHGEAVADVGLPDGAARAVDDESIVMTVNAADGDGLALAVAAGVGGDATPTPAAGGEVGVEVGSPTSVALIPPPQA